MGDFTPHTATQTSSSSNSPPTSKPPRTARPLIWWSDSTRSSEANSIQGQRIFIRRWANQEAAGISSGQEWPWARSHPHGPMLRPFLWGGSSRLLGRAKALAKTWAKGWVLSQTSFASRPAPALAGGGPCPGTAGQRGEDHGALPSLLEIPGC